MLRNYWHLSLELSYFLNKSRISSAKPLIPLTPTKLRQTSSIYQDTENFTDTIRGGWTDG